MVINTIIFPPSFFFRFLRLLLKIVESDYRSPSGGGGGKSLVEEGVWACLDVTRKENNKIE